MRACDEQQGTLALTIQGRGFDSTVSASQNVSFMDSECVSCGACVQACPTATLSENTLIEKGQAEHSVTTTCAYCGVGCSFRAEMQGEEVVRMVPNKDGHANHGHSCVKGRFAIGYATHRDRILKPMIRAKISDPWREVSWEEAIGYAASELKRIQSKYGRDSIGGITSSRCTNEETYLVQKLVRAGFGNNNVDTCARVCHSPDRLRPEEHPGRIGGHAEFRLGDEGRRDLRDRRESDRWTSGVRLADEAPAAPGRAPHHRRSAPHRPGAHPAHRGRLSPETQAGHQCRADQLPRPCHRHGGSGQGGIRPRALRDAIPSRNGAASSPQARNSPEAMEAVTGVPAADVRAAARLYATGGNGAIYYGLGVTEHSQGSTMVMGIANLAMATGNVGREGVGVNPLRGQNNVQGSCDMGSFPHEFPGYRHVSDDAVRAFLRDAWGVTLQSEPGLRIPNMFEAALDGEFKGLYIEGEDIAQSDPNTQHVTAALQSMECIIVQDLFLNESAKFAHVFLPGSSFLEKDGTFTNAERRISRVRKVMQPKAATPTGKSPSCCRMPSATP